RAARDRRAELRRDWIFARHRRRHREIAPGARPRRAPRATEGRMTELTCAAVRSRLAAFHDDELPGQEQVSVQAPLKGCDGCLEALQSGFEDIASALRLAAAPGPADDWTGLTPGVISRMRAEANESWHAQLARTFDDLHLVWIGL